MISVNKSNRTHTVKTFIEAEHRSGISLKAVSLVQFHQNKLKTIIGVLLTCKSIFQLI